MKRVSVRTPKANAGLPRVQFPRARRGSAKKIPTVVVLGIVSSEGHVMSPYIFDAGTEFTTEVYLHVMEKVVVPWCNKVAEGKPWVWQQDASLVHKNTQQWLEDKETNGVYSHVPFSHWPSCSPDCNPLDYFVWSYVETLINRKTHNTKDSVIAEIILQFSLLPSELVQKSCSMLRSRLESVVAADGNFVE